MPVSLIALHRRAPLPEALLLGLASQALPFLQVRLAAKVRLRALFEYLGMRDRFGRVPWAFAVMSLLTLMCALPLSLLEIERIPREAAWLPILVFIGLTFPARLLTGWAYSRSSRRERSRHGLFPGSTRLTQIPVVALNVLIVFLSQDTAWSSIWSLSEQHAFLLPVPFLNV